MKSSSRISQLRWRKRLRRNVLRLIVRVSAWCVIALILFGLISWLYETPYERNINRISESLDSELDRLQARYDSLEMVLVNVEARDRNIFNTMFESEPYTIITDLNSERVQLYESFIKLSNQELREQLRSRVVDLEQRVNKLTSSTMRMVESIDTLDVKSRRIPAIQPVVNDQLTLLTASFGERLNPYYNRVQMHNGVDYTVPEGTRVFATADGIIKRYSLGSSDTGKCVVVDHQNGYETIYNHLSKIDFPRSYRVKRGDIIGMSGNTGLSFSPHLHYEIRYNGESVNPIDYFFMELTPLEYQRIRQIAQYGMQSFD